MEELILLNAGGRHIKVIQDIISALKGDKSLHLHAIIDDTHQETTQKNEPLHKNTDYLQNLYIDKYKFCITIGANHARKQMFAKQLIPIDQYTSLIHPSAVISDSAKIGYGTVIMPNAVVNADTVIGNHCIINSNATVEHDCLIEDYVHISPGVTLPGGITIREGVQIGSGASAIPEIKVGEWSVVGAGAVITCDINPYTTAVGVPAKPFKR